jgi:molecular chaperone GrpE
VKEKPTPPIVEEPEDIEEAVKDEEVEIINWQAAAEEKEKQCAETFDRLQRTMAEFDNFRKRTAKEKSSMYNDGARDTLEKLLPVVDNLERALSSTDERESGIYKGVEMIFRQLQGILQQIGVEALPGEGESFDPNIHHAVAHVEDENVGEGVIVEELQRGYKYKEKILRPSMVKVAN